MKHLQADLEQMMREYAKMKELSLEQQNVIIGLEQTYQDLKEQHVVAHIEFEREKQNVTA